MGEHVLQGNISYRKKYFNGIYVQREDLYVLLDDMSYTSICFIGGNVLQDYMSYIRTCLIT